jgi:hypothetical protein
MSNRKTRPLTAVDKLLAYGDSIDRALGETSKARRRTHRRFGKLDVVLVEQTDEPTVVYLTNGGDADIVEATAGELAEAAAAVKELLTNPPPVKRKR